jgi:hypothetical protein
VSEDELGELVAVVWLDAHASTQSEMSGDEISATEPTVYTSYGKLVRCDATLVAVAADERDDGRFRGITFIPRAMVRSIKPLRRRRKKPVDPDPGETTP